MDCTLWSSSQLCCNNNRPCDAMLNCIERLCTFYIQHRVPMPAMERTSFSLMALSAEIEFGRAKKTQTKSATNTRAQFQHIILSSTESCLLGVLLIAIRLRHIVSKLQAFVKENSWYFFRQY